MTATLRSPENAIDIVDPRCLDPQAVGRKAEALARARRIGIPVLEAMVLTTEFTAEIDAGGSVETNPGIDAVLERFGEQTLAVRSSSTAEDLSESSQAGRFETVLGVSGRSALVAAVGRVLESRKRAAEGSDLDADHPIAVLIQPFVAARSGGVLFGVDPVSGRSDRLVVVAGNDPGEIVSGVAEGIRNDLTPDGDRADEGSDADLPADLRRSLADLARRTEAEFGGPQDLEWLVDDEDRLWLLQSRPVTTAVRGVPEGPIYGPGPVAETFPDPLNGTERDLWVPPLRQAMREALVLAGAAKRAEVDARPIVVAPGGRVAVDLEITGELDTGSFWKKLSPARVIRRLGSAWRIGRLRAALPGLAAGVIEQTDRELRGVPSLDSMTDRQLLSLLRRSQRALISLHAHEILMGLLVERDRPQRSAAAVALRVLCDARADGLDDATIIANYPIVLALTVPAIGGDNELPPTPEQLPPAPKSGEAAGVAGMRREALRVRVRWLHELGARAALEAGRRLTARDRLDAPEAIRDLGLENLENLILGRAAPAQTEVDTADTEAPAGTFQFSSGGLPISVPLPGAAADAVGAGGGVAIGTVTHNSADPPPGSVLVVGRLRPELAPVLPRLAGLVAETGNPLAHLAILAREAGVATVVRVGDARSRFAEGDEVEVDGVSGQIELLGAATRGTTT